MILEVKKLDPHAKLPTYAYDSDAGLDIFVMEDFVVPSGKFVASIRTGIAVAIPEGFVGLMWAKSGLAINHGIIVMAGVIDAGYRGEILLTVYNAGLKDYEFKSGDKVMQMLIQRVAHVELIKVENLPPTPRGDGGFGSTGK